MSNVPEIAELTVEYSLFDLPSVQHKAGLAGFCLLVKSLEKLRIEPRPEIEIDDDPAQTTRIKLTPESLKSVYDHFFAAISRDGKILPAAKFLDTLGMPASWINLWRSVIANVLRAGAPAQFKQFRDRVDPQKAVDLSDWQETFNELVADSADALSGSDALGVESKNAERVPFRDLSRLKLLLTFWPVVSVPYRSSVLKPESNVANYRLHHDSYLFVTPEVASLVDFIDEYPDFLAECLDGKTVGESTLPINSSVTCPTEGGLRFLAPRQVVSDATRRYPLADFVSTVEIAQVKYGKGSPSILAIQSLEPESGLLNQYERIRDGCWNPIWRVRRIQNLLNHEPWYTEAVADFNAYRWELFIQITGSTPKRIPFFGRDISKVFRELQINLKQQKGGQMSEKDKDDELAVRVYKLMRQYVNRKTEDKTNLDFKAYQSADAKSRKDYRDARESVSRDAFLALRGRHDQDFVSYFIGTLCSIPQFLPEREFVAVSNELLSNPERIKTLSMLALSAHSYLADKDDVSKS